MKIAVLTSSRADYSIYLPLLRLLQADSSVDLDIVAFGTHVSRKHGYTIDAITNDGFTVAHALDTAPGSDSPEAITRAMADTMVKLSEVWSKNHYDLVFCLGDRYEMFAACASTVPYNIKLAHIHGGEETLGAIDNVFRHSITHMATIHFTAAMPYFDRVVNMRGSDKHVYNVGALSFDNLRGTQLLSIQEFKERFGIDLSVPTILITFHPETISFERNETYVRELIAALDQIQSYQYVITMPNADTMGNMVRSHLKEFIERSSRAIGVESFGTIGYLSCMKHCTLMLGNTSSGFIEAAFFRKYVINLGQRQQGRIVTPNIVQSPIEKDAIVRAVDGFRNWEQPDVIDIYGDGTAAEKIMRITKQL